MPRPRSISDDEVLHSALAIVRRQGPARLTFAILAKETGLAPATLVQRFGSKLTLVQATLHHAWDLLDARTAAYDAEAPVSPEGAVQMLVALSEGHAAGDFADSLLVLREDLRDPLLRARGQRWGETLCRLLARRLDDGSGPRSDLGRVMAAQWQGAVLWWGFDQSRPVTEYVAEALYAFCAAVGIEAGPRERS